MRIYRLAPVLNRTLLNAVTPHRAGPTADGLYCWMFWMFDFRKKPLPAVKRCPICKEQPKLVRRLFAGPRFICKNEGHTVHSGNARTVDEAAMLWNSLPEIRQLVGGQ